MSSPSESQPRRVLLTASGTGGHIMPAVYIAQHLQKQEVELLYVGSGRRLEEDLVSPLGITCRVISASGLRNRGLKGVIQFLLGFPSSLLKTFRILREFNPDVVLGTGGYVTFYPVLCAWIKGVPTWIHEAEREAGLANRVLSFFATKISTAFPDTNFARKSAVTYSGHPVRQELLEVGDVSAEVEIPRNLLVLGGSQGARILDKTLQELAPRLKEMGINIWHQCRPEHVDELKAIYTKHGIEHQVMSFVQDIHEAYEWAHCVIARAGAGTVMEIGVVRRPAIFVPLPNVDKDHQTKNAQLLASQGRAVVVLQGESFSERLLTAIERLCDGHTYSEMLTAKGEDRPKDAAKVIAEGVLDLATGSRS